MTLIAAAVLIIIIVGAVFMLKNKKTAPPEQESTATPVETDSPEKEYELIDLKIFGSKAKNTDDPDSDVDVLIMLKDYTKEAESRIDDLIYEINIKYDCLITALFFGKKEIEEGPVSESPIYKKICQEGIAL